MLTLSFDGSSFPFDAIEMILITGSRALIMYIFKQMNNTIIVLQIFFEIMMDGKIHF